MSDPLDKQGGSLQLPPGEPHEQIAAIMDRPDAREFVGAIDAPVLYQLVIDAGWEAAQELVPYLTAMQLQTCLDLDCWTKDQFHPAKVAPWLAALVVEADDATFRRQCRDLEPEVLALFFQTYLLVDVYGEEREIPEQFWDKQVEPSPDGVYALVYTGDDSINALMRATVKRLYARDMVLAWTLLEATRWELRSTMEEEALRWRTSRLEEWGYVDLDEAMQIYKPLDGQRLRERVEAGGYEPKLAAESLANLPVLAELTDEDRYYAAQRIRALPTEEREPVMREFVALQNRATIADGVDPGDRSEAQAVAERTTGYLSIGLEFLSRRNDDRAAEILRSVPIRDIFRAGFTTVDRLRDNVHRIRRRPTLTLVEGERFSLLREFDANLCEAIANARPAFSDETGTRDLFHTQSQIDAAALRLGLIAFKQLWLFGVQRTGPAELVQRAQGGVWINEPPELTFDAFFGTAVAQVLVGHAPDTLGLSPEDLHALPARLSEARWEGALLDTFEVLVGPVLETLPAAARLLTRWLEQTLAELSDELAAVQSVDASLMTFLLVLQGDAADA